MGYVVVIIFSMDILGIRICICVVLNGLKGRCVVWSGWLMRRSIVLIF